MNGSAELLEIANRSFDEFGIPRWAQMRGLRGEVALIEDLVPSVNLMHAGVLLHSNEETAEATPCCWARRHGPRLREDHRRGESVGAFRVGSKCERSSVTRLWGLSSADRDELVDGSDIPHPVDQRR